MGLVTIIRIASMKPITREKKVEISTICTVSQVAMRISGILSCKRSHKGCMSWASWARVLS